MANLFKYRFIQTLREKGNMFWGLAFPIILGTFFYFAFGSLGTETWNNIPVAVVEASSNEAFSQYMDALDGDLLDITCMSEQEAENALQEGTVTGIFYEETEPSLTVAANGMEETMLSSLMDSYAKNASMIADILQTHPENLQTVLSELSDYSSFTENSSLGGRTYDNVLDYFFALIAMGCFYGSFLGISLANENMANMSPLGARRSSAPVSKLKLVAVDMGTGFLIHFINVVLLLCYLNFVLKIDFSGNWGGMLLICLLGTLTGVSFGIAVGCAGRLKAGMKTFLAVVCPLITCFLAGLMFGNIKQLIEQTCPVINRINPATLISDAFYYLIVYNDSGKLAINLITLAVISLGLASLAFFSMRRERYDSI